VSFLCTARVLVLWCNLCPFCVLLVFLCCGVTCVRSVFCCVLVLLCNLCPFRTRAVHRTDTSYTTIQEHKQYTERTQIIPQHKNTSSTQNGHKLHHNIVFLCCGVNCVRSEYYLCSCVTCIRSVYCLFSCVTYVRAVYCLCSCVVV
jgi:hypothetical protein